MRRNSLGCREMTRGRRSLRARCPAAIMHPAKWRGGRGRGDEGPITSERLGFETLGFGLISLPQFHSLRHLFRQPMLRRSTTKPSQINALNLVGKSANAQALERIPRFGEKKPHHSAPAPSRFLAKSPQILGNIQAHPGLRACLRKGRWRRKGNREGNLLCFP